MTEWIEMTHDATHLDCGECTVVCIGVVSFIESEYFSLIDLIQLIKTIKTQTCKKKKKPAF